MALFAENIRNLKNIVVVHLLCFSQCFIQSPKLQQPFYQVVVALCLAADTQERLIINGVSFQSEQKFGIVLTHIFGVPIDSEFKRLTYPPCDHAPFVWGSPPFQHWW